MSEQAELPLAMKIAQASKFSGMSRSSIYELLALGEIDARKAGKSTLILTRSLVDYMNRLPKAEVRSARAQKRAAAAMAASA